MVIYSKLNRFLYIFKYKKYPLPNMENMKLALNLIYKKSKRNIPYLLAILKGKFNKINYEFNKI